MLPSEGNNDMEVGMGMARKNDGNKVWIKVIIH
jgi:hypothetical protein